jgi:hypothetical protein
MEIIIKRDFNLITIFSNYSINVNGENFKLKKSGEYPINVKNTDEINISVIAHNYYSGKSKITYLKSNERIFIRTKYNKKIFGLIFLLSIFCFVLGLIYGNSILAWPAIMLLLAYQLYYFHVKRAMFFQILVQKK